jgi:hypothetical protein
VHQLFTEISAACYHVELTLIRRSSRYVRETGFLDPPEPSPQQKTAGRTATLLNGHLNSCAATFSIYLLGESGASRLLAGGVV